MQIFPHDRIHRRFFPNCPDPGVLKNIVVDGDRQIHLQAPFTRIFYYTGSV